MGGGRRWAGPSGGRTAEPRLPGPLEELMMLAKVDTPVSARKLVGLVKEFGAEKRKQQEVLDNAQEFIFLVYNCFTPSERVRFFAMLYDMFAERYDEHMSETGHYRAIRRAMLYGMPFLRTPMLDITAGTGEPLRYAIEFIGTGGPLLQSPLDILVPKGRMLETKLDYPFYANEISSRMRGIAEAKLQAFGDVAFTNHNAYRLTKELKGKFATVLCSQTFHLISDDDKTKLVRSIREALARGGVAVVIEEDPFKITQSAPIEAVSLFLRAIVRPIDYPEKLHAYFVTNGFTRLAYSATAPIDSEHNMILHVFVRD